MEGETGDGGGHDEGRGRMVTRGARPAAVFGVAEARELSRLEVEQDLAATHGTQVGKLNILFNYYLNNFFFSLPKVLLYYLDALYQ